MQVKKGIAVSPGVSIAKAIVVGQEVLWVQRRHVADSEVDEEVRRLDQALQEAAEDIDCEIQRLGEEFKVPRQVLESHRDIVLDPGLRDAITTRIRDEKMTAEHALTVVIAEYSKRFQSFNSTYLAERSNDLEDIERQVLRRLLGRTADRWNNLDGEVIVIARNLSPSETASFDKERVVGFATDTGGRTSHTAILARSLQIPAVVGLESLSRQIRGGEEVIVDGYSGQVIVDPDPETLETYQKKAASSREFFRDLHEEVRWPAETLDGYRIQLAANIEFPDEVHSALDWGASGVGLYRTEFLYEHGEPDEETHLRNYRQAVSSLDGRELTIRTLDAGADKFHEEAVGEPEPNPFLGCRSIRLCLEREDLFRAQIRAALKVSAEGPVKIMLPMVSALNEIRRSRAIIDDVRAELEAEGVAVAERVPVGAMIEVPSIALIADRIATEVDFFSIGTNDLVQYCLAVDRVNERVAHLYQPAHPAILRVMRSVIVAGQSAGIPVTICGEMCSEPLYAVLLLGLGLTSFSVSPISIPTVKRVIRQITMADAVEVANQCLACDDASESLEILEVRVRNLLPDYF